MAYCQHCGTSLSVDSTFCPSCGKQTAQAITGSYTAKVKIKRDPKKTILIISVCAIAVFAILFALGVFKSDEERIRDRLDAFAKSYNTGDSEATIKCFDARTRNALEGMFGITDTLTSKLTGFGFDTNDLFSVGVSTTMDEGMSFEILDIEIQGNEATVTAIMRIDMNGTIGDLEEKAVIEMVKEGRDWYIHDMTSAK